MRKIKPFHWVLAIVLLAIPISFSAYAAQGGRFTYIKGRVDITSPEQAARPASVGDEVTVGDIIRVKSESRAEITFVDGNILRLAENTRVEISEYAVGEDQTRGTLTLYRGKIQSIVKSFLGEVFGREKKNRYEVHTPTAVCGVRGTNFFTWYTKGVSGAAFQEGQGYGYSANRPDEVKEIKTGEAMLVVSPDLPPMIRPATGIELEQHLDDTAPVEGEETSTRKESSGGPDLVKGAEASEKFVPTLPPQAQSESKTGFSGTLSGGILPSGAFSGTVKDKKGEGRISLSGSFSGTPSGGYTDDLAGAMTDGSALKGYLGSAIGSHRGVFSSLYLTPAGGAGYFYGAVSGDMDLARNTLSASGTVYRSTVFGQLDLEGKTPADNLSGLGSLDENILPILGSINAGGGFSDDGSFCADIQSAGLDTTSGRKLGVWGVNTSGGEYSNELRLKSWSGVYGEKDSSYYSLGTISGADDLAGHLSVSGTLTYLDANYLGTINLWYRGAYQTPEEKEAILSSDYDSTGAGTFTRDPLAYSGTWGSAPAADTDEIVGCLYYDDDGMMSKAGSDYGLLGGLRAPWANATADLYAVGAYTDSGPGGRYLFNTSISGSDPGNGLNLFQGYAGGFWNEVPTIAGSVSYGTLSGVGYAIYMDKDGKAGLLKDPTLSGYFYPDLLMWSAAGTWTRSFKETVSNRSDYDTSTANITNAALAGTFGPGSSISGSGTGMTLFFKDTENHQSLPWGLYNLKLGSPNTFSNKPNGLANWSAVAGGKAVFGYAAGEEDDGYWLADVGGTWSDDGKINGNLSSGTYLAKNQMGSLGGPFSGINTLSEATSGTWIGQSIGTFEGKPLAFSGEASGGKLLHFNGSSLVGGLAAGLLGSLDALWPTTSAAPASILLMGDYSEGWERGREPIFSASVKSHNPYDGSVTIWNQADNSQNGAYYGFIGGRGQEDYQGQGMIRALYLDPSGNAGFLKGQFDVQAYSDLKMWEGTGSFFPLQIVTGTGYDAAKLHADEGGLLYTYSDQGSMEEAQGEFPDSGGLINWLKYQRDTASISSSDSTWHLGVTSMVFGGNYDPGEGSGPDLNHWVRDWDTRSDEASIGSVGAYVSAGDAPGSWSNGLILGKGYEAWVNWNDALTGVSGAELKGTFDPTSKNWQASALWALMDTNTFLNLAATIEGRTQLAQINIPCIEIGKDTLTGRGGYTGEMTVNMVETTFFAYSTGARPRIWASGNVNGSGSAGAMEINQTVGLQGISNSTLRTDFMMRTWNDGTMKWTANVNNGEGTVGGHAISFSGAAVGSITSSSTFSGTASGVAAPQ